MYGRRSALIEMVTPFLLQNVESVYFAKPKSAPTTHFFCIQLGVPRLNWLSTQIL